MDYQELLKNPLVVAGIGGAFTIIVTHLNGRMAIAKDHAQWERQEKTEQAKTDNERESKRTEHRNVIFAECIGYLFALEDWWTRQNLVTPGTYREPELEVLHKKAVVSLIKTLALLDDSDDDYINLVINYFNIRKTEEVSSEIRRFLIAKLTDKEWVPGKPVDPPKVGPLPLLHNMRLVVNSPPFPPKKPQKAEPGTCDSVESITPPQST